MSNFFIYIYYILFPPFIKEREDKVTVMVDIYGREENWILVDTTLLYQGDKVFTIAPPPGLQLKARLEQNILHF